MRRYLWSPVIAVALIVALGATAADARTYRTPGFRGIRTPPPTLPAPPPTPIPLAPSGALPQVLVDDAGTGHITWKEDRGDSADVVRYCRLKRGASACEASHDLVPQQPGPSQFNIENSPPRAVVIGDQLAVLTNRYPIVVETPDGGSDDSNTYLFTSQDGGSSFDPPALVGNNNLSGQPAVFGPPEAQRIGLISDTRTGGAFFQAISAGRYERREVVLGPEGLYSSLAPVGNTVAAAFAGIDGSAHVRQWTGQGDIYDAATWTDIPIPNDGRFLEPLLASGPSGLFLLTTAGGGGWEVRRVSGDGTSLGAPVRIPGSENSAFRDFFQDSAGRLYVTYRKSVPDSALQLRVSSDGTTWSAPQTLRPFSTEVPIHSSDTATASDGGGFTVLHEGGSYEGSILAVPIGNQGPSGLPGIAGLPGGEADPGLVQTCQKIAFGEIEIRATQGCLLGVAGRRHLRVSEGPVSLNGIEIVPDPGAKIVFNTQTREIQSFGNVTVQERARGVSPIVLFRGVLQINLRGEQAAARAAGAQPDAGDEFAKRCTGQRLAAFTATNQVLKGFPIKGKIDVYVQDLNSCVDLALELPEEFGGVRGQAILRADNLVGLHLDSLKIEADEVHLGPVLIEDLLVRYAVANDEWAGEVTLGLPPQPGGAKLGAEIKFEGGAFKEGSLKLGFPYPGIVLDPFAASYLTEVGGTFGIDPVTIGAEATIGVLPVPPDLYTFSVEGELTASFGDPVKLELEGTGKVFDLPIAEEKLSIDTNGFARVDAKSIIDLGPVLLDGGFIAFVDFDRREFGARFTGKVCIYACAQESVVFSTNGMGACLPIGGFGYRWGDTLPDLMLLSCDLSEYELKPPPAARAAQATGRTFDVPAGARTAALRVTGSGGAPRVAFVSPTGERIVPATDGSDSRAIAVSDGAVTFLGIRNPEPGQWRVETEAGSPPIAELAQARELPTPRVSARVGGSGRRRVLSYRATTGNGLRTTFVETSPSGSRVIGRARGRRGSIRFSPAPFQRGRRIIEAIVERNGKPRMRETVGAYNAPPPARPGRVRGLKLVRRGRRLGITWRRVSGAHSYDVRVDLPNGRRGLEVVRGRTTRLRLNGLPRKGRIVVRVTARDIAGRTGRTTRARR